MHILLNGESTDVPAPLDVAGLLAHLGLAEKRVAVEVNREIVPRSLHAARALREGDAVELVHAMGGG